MRANYETREELYAYMKKFVRIKSHKLVLFGYQVIGGSELPIVSVNADEATTQDQVEVMSTNVRN